jgi:phosphotriesterase-related protein
MATVNTVLGPVNTADLGFTLSHEHIMVSAAGMRHTYPQFHDRQGTIEDGVTALKEAYDEGVRTIIDMTTFDLGRDIQLLEEVSRRSGVNIILTSGAHQTVPRVFWTVSPDDIAPLYVREVQEGIDGTSIKAAVIKSASDRGGITDREMVNLRAVARAQKTSGARISTHTWSPDRVGEQQIAVLEEEGVDLNRVYIGHSNDDTDLDYLLGMLRKGVWVGLDRFPGGRVAGTPQWQQRTEMVKRLIDAGFGHRIMLGHDHSIPRAQPTQQLRDERRNYNPDGYLFITRKVLPYLSELGVSDGDINQIMVDNPRRFFEDG